MTLYGLRKIKKIVRFSRPIIERRKIKQRNPRLLSILKEKRARGVVTVNE